jgi:Dockerin type I domain
MPITIQMTGSYTNRTAKGLSVFLLIILVCSAIVLSVHPTSAHSYRSTSVSDQYATSASGTPGTSIFIQPTVSASASMIPGTNVTINVFINNVTNLDAWEYKVKVDTGVLKAVGADVTPYWETQQAQSKGLYIIQVNATQGTAFVYWVSLRQPDGTIPSLTTTVPFQLGTATFQVLGTTQDTPFHIVTYQEDPKFGTLLYDTSLNFIDYRSTDGTFANLRAPWDINWDLKVNIVDLVLVARAFGTTPGSPGWNPLADIDGDGHVDITDLTIVAIHFGQNI